MDNKVWKIIGSVLAVAIISALGFCTVWTIRNWNTVYSSLNGSSIYTYTELQESRQSGYEEGAKNEAEYQKTIVELRDLLSKSQIENNELSSKVSILDEVRSQLAITETERARLKTISDDYQEVFSMVKDELLEIELPDNAVVVFESEGILYDIFAVKKGTGTADNLVINEPTKPGHYHFVGWSLNGSDVVDLSMFPVNENVTLKAVFEINYYTVNIIDNGDTILSVQVAYDSTVSSSDIETALNKVKYAHRNDFSDMDEEIIAINYRWVVNAPPESGYLLEYVDLENYKVTKAVDIYAWVTASIIPSDSEHVNLEDY